MSPPPVRLLARARPTRSFPERATEPVLADHQGVNRSLFLLAVCQALFLTNNVTFIAINGLVGLKLAPLGWMATLPVMGYVVGGALASAPVARMQALWGRQRSFQVGLAVAIVSAALGAVAVALGSFWGVGGGHRDRGGLQRQRAAVPLCRSRAGGASAQGEGDLAGDGRRRGRRFHRAEPGQRHARTGLPCPLPVHTWR